MTASSLPFRSLHACLGRESISASLEGSVVPPAAKFQEQSYSQMSCKRSGVETGSDVDTMGRADAVVVGGAHCVCQVNELLQSYARYSCPDDSLYN